MRDGEYDTATAVIDFAKRLQDFEKKVEALSGEWDQLEELRDKASPAVQEIVSKRFFGKSRKGEITSHKDFFRPLLEVLVEMGGGGKTVEVLDCLGEKMKPVLVAKDYEPHRSDAKQIRWRNSAQWARNALVHDFGRMRADSPRGVWEISDKGRAWLREGEIDEK